MPVNNSRLSGFVGFKPKMKTRKCLPTKTLLSLCLFAMSLLTLLSVYTALKCIREKTGWPSEAGSLQITGDHGLGVWRVADRQPTEQDSRVIQEPGHHGDSLVWQIEEPWASRGEEASRDRLLRDTYILKYTELRERHLLQEYPVQKPCRDQPIPDAPCDDTECIMALPRDPETRIDSFLSVIQKAPMNFVNPLEPVTADLPFSHVTIVTAVSASRYHESTAMIETLHQNVFPKFKTVSFYVYDLGLSQDQVEQMTSYCRCQVIKFPFEEVQYSIREASCNSWKPLIVHAHLPKTNILIWADASVRFNTNQGDDLYEDVIKKGFLSSLSERYPGSVAHHTANTTLQFFDMEPCTVSSFQELDASLMAFHNQPFTKEVIVGTWAACALVPDCICPEGSLSMQRCDRGLRMYSNCHGFDRSVISLIMLKLFQEHYITFTFNQAFYSVQAVQPSFDSKYFKVLDRVT